MVLRDTSTMRYPPRTRPFKSPMENVELDKPLQRAAQKGEYEHKIVLNAGISRREAMARIHHSSALLFSRDQV